MGPLAQPLSLFLQGFLVDDRVNSSLRLHLVKDTRPCTGRPIMKVSFLAKGRLEGRRKNSCCRGLPRELDALSNFLENLLVRILVVLKKLFP